MQPGSVAGNSEHLPDITLPSWRVETLHLAWRKLAWFILISQKGMDKLVLNPFQ